MPEKQETQQKVLMAFPFLSGFDVRGATVIYRVGEGTTKFEPGGCSRPRIIRPWRYLIEGERKRSNSESPPIGCPVEGRGRALGRRGERCN